MTQYFAQLDENNIVISVHVVSAEFMAENPQRYTGTWVETFYNHPTKTYAGLAWAYDYDTQDFIAPIAPPIEQ